jgi:Icc-related predicted phosphoesterase
MGDMNNMPNVSYPSYLNLGKVNRPSFLMHLGDITEHGYASEWNSPSLGDQRSYVQTLEHLDSRIKTYETLGNHDGKTNDIRTAIAAKQGNTYYSFNDQGVHVVVLDPYKKSSIRYPDLDDEQLAWLKNDLKAQTTQTPTIFTMHVWPDTTTGDRTCHLGTSSQKLAQVIDDTNVLAFLHGHGHAGGKTSWNGIDVLSTGFCYMRSGCPGGTPTFQVINITDDRMVALEYNWDANRWGSVLVNKAIVPEPATLTLLGLAGAGILVRRRKAA